MIEIFDLGVIIPLGSETAYRLASATGYTIWSFQGNLLHQQTSERLEQLHSFQWRPHPPTSMTWADKLEIRARLKDYSKKLESVDNINRTARKVEVAAFKASIRSEFNAAIDKANKWLEEQPEYSEWMTARAEAEDPSRYEQVVQEIEHEISVTIKPTNAVKTTAQ